MEKNIVQNDYPCFWGNTARRAKSKTAPQEIGVIYNYKRNQVVKNLQQIPATRPKRKKDTYEGKI